MRPYINSIEGKGELIYNFCWFYNHHSGKRNFILGVISAFTSWKESSCLKKCSKIPWKCRGDDWNSFSHSTSHRDLRAKHCEHIDLAREGRSIPSDPTSPLRDVPVEDVRLKKKKIFRCHKASDRFYRLKKRINPLRFVPLILCNEINLPFFVDGARIHNVLQRTHAHDGVCVVRVRVRVCVCTSSPVPFEIKSRRSKSDGQRGGRAAAYNKSMGAIKNKKVVALRDGGGKRK